MALGLGLWTVIPSLPCGSASGLFHWRTRPTPSCFPGTLTHGRFGGQAGCLAGRPSLETSGAVLPCSAACASAAKAGGGASGRKDKTTCCLTGTASRALLKPAGPFRGPSPGPSAVPGASGPGLCLPCCGMYPGLSCLSPAAPGPRPGDPQPPGPLALPVPGSQASP